MEKLWIGTNWKMHKTLSEGLSYTEQLIEMSKDIDQRVELFIIPPYTSLWPIKNLVNGTRIQLGSQNSHWEKQGPYTGEISPEMLKEIGLDIIELGHSERRQYYNETDLDISKKIRTVLDFDMRPLVCIGENLSQKNRGIAEEVIAMQLKVCLFNVNTTEIGKLLIAYEPVWAIGELGIPATTEDVSKIHSVIRRVLVEKFGNQGKQIPILYGGSVNEKNSMEYLKLQDVNGLFIGRAAWNIVSFRKILSDVNDYVKNENSVIVK